MASPPRGAPFAVALLAALAGCGNRDVQDRIYAPRTAPDGGAADAAPFAVSIHQPRWLEAISTRETDALGRPVEVRCETCHSTQQFRLPDSVATLGGPHAGMRFEHGTNQCNSCHDPAQFNRLRLATGESIPMTESMRLCSQCHGLQARDYQHGAHGGMNGYWDLQRGPRTRNHCADCHDSHTPRFPQFSPAPPPRDLPTSHRPSGAGSHG
ncbi:MAG: hypothetical protein U0269_36320 [Polyangiales bacterium]